MKKIMFNDKYGLTEAVLEGRKTMTRRIVNFDRVPTLIPGRIAECCLKYAPFKVGEVVAVAQKYWDLRDCGAFYEAVTKADPSFPIECIEGEKGCHNKMFVRAEWMPHLIRITNVRVERLQDISDEDCLNEGVFLGQFHTYSYVGRPRCPFNTPRDAFASLIDRISGKGTWASNPWVFVYEFELVK